MPDELRELLARFEQLVADHDDAAPAEDAPDEGEGNFRCEGCVRCANCRFCTDCEDCDDCTYCEACLQCQGCTQSRECVGCVGLSHSAHTGYCEGGSHLTLCYDCRDCVQCFACVGLQEAEFHILNRKYPRREYFKMVGELRTQLEAIAVEGWFPPWIEADEPALRSSPPVPPREPPAAPREPVPVAAVAPVVPRTKPEPPVAAPPPFARQDTDTTLATLLAALDGPEIETEPLDPGQVFGERFETLLTMEDSGPLAVDSFSAPRGELSSFGPRVPTLPPPPAADRPAPRPPEVLGPSPRVGPGPVSERPAGGRGPTGGSRSAATPDAAAPSAAAPAREHAPVGSDRAPPRMLTRGARPSRRR